MEVIRFGPPAARFALKVDAVERILGPGETAAGRRVVSLARLLEIEPESETHLALLAGADMALAIGRPTGTARIDPAWIIPLPGYIFRVARAPFRGLIQTPAAVAGGRRAESWRALLLDADRLIEMSEPPR